MLGPVLSSPQPPLLRPPFTLPRPSPSQVAHADQQLRDLGKFQVATDALKSREPQAKPQLDLSIDSLDLSCEEGTPLTITRSGGTLPPAVCCPLSAHCSIRLYPGHWGCEINKT